MQIKIKKVITKKLRLKIFPSLNVWEMKLWNKTVVLVKWSLNSCFCSSFGLCILRCLLFWWNHITSLPSGNNLSHDYTWVMSKVSMMFLHSAINFKNLLQSKFISSVKTICCKNRFYLLTLMTKVQETMLFWC